MIGDCQVKARNYAGLGILTIVVLIVALTQINRDKHKDSLVVDGLIGGKIAFLQDPDVVNYLENEYGLTVTAKRVGSFDQIDQCVAPLDFCWPSSETAGALMEAKLGASALDCQIIFNSPIVMYTWTPIADALIAQGIVEQRGDTLYLTDLAKLVEMIDNQVQWSAIGLSDLYGTISIRSSDPTASNTGNSFVGLLANTYNGGQVVDETTVDTILPLLQAFVSRMGLIPDTTTEMFDQFFTLGMGAAPIIVAYESNLIEYALTHPTASNQKYISDNVRTLYPEPTVWSSQPMCALTEGGMRLIEALRDPEIQRLGWEDHGFRTGVPGITNNPKAVPVPGVPGVVLSIIQMPKPAVMIRIIQYLEGSSVTSNPMAMPEVPPRAGVITGFAAGFRDEHPLAGRYDWPRTARI